MPDLIPYVHIRYVEFSDLMYLIDVDLKSFPVGWESDRWNEVIRSYRECCVCVTISDTPVAFAVFERDGNQLKIVRLAVTPSHRKKGVGKLLVDWLTNYATDRKISRLSVLVSEDNLMACSFLKANGFKVPPRGIVPKKFLNYGEPLDGYYFLKIVGEIKNAFPDSGISI